MIGVLHVGSRHHYFASFVFVFANHASTAEAYFFLRLAVRRFFSRLIKGLGNSAVYMFQL